jgi:DNA-binding Xre family transcriptional regulator
MKIQAMPPRKIERHTIHCRLQEWIENSGENYSTIAVAIGVDVNTIRRLAKDSFDRVDCATWQAICGYFERPIGELFYEEA